MRLERCDSREAVRRLQNGEKRDAGSVSLSPGVGERPAAGGPLPVLRPAAVSAIRILSDASLRHPALVGYLASRGIVPSVAAAFCREVRYEVNGRAFSPSGSATMTEGGSCAPHGSKAAPRPNTLPHSKDAMQSMQPMQPVMSVQSLQSRIAQQPVQQHHSMPAMIRWPANRTGPCRHPMQASWSSKGS